MFRSWKRKRRRKKALKKIKDAVYAFIFLNRALIQANVSRQVRRQLKRDLMTRSDPEGILMLFVKQIQEAADRKTVRIGKDKGNTRDLPSTPRPAEAPKGQKVQKEDTITTVSPHME